MLTLIAILLSLGALVHLGDLVNINPRHAKWERGLQLVLGLLQLVSAAWCWAQIFGWW